MLCGRMLEQLNFNLPESPDVTANNLNKFLAFIVQTFQHCLTNYQQDLFPNLSLCFPSEIERRIGNLEKQLLSFGCPVSSY